MPKVIEEESTRKISLEKSTLEKTKKQDNTRCQSIFYKIFTSEIEIKPLDPDYGENPENCDLEIDLNNIQDMKLSQRFKHFRLFNINQAWVFNAESKNRNFEDFLEFSFPNKTNEFYFSSGIELDLNRSNYE
ncbi:unnamed protein product [Moneuplotes crassus]|uniref:Uncharacterized protein n=1 Tax=Euplotes crassus TaxID=5936 RepID=A0AAD1XT44_EUPCR|nr:unnamed protein product [Moneuplotes crassus]